MTKPPLYLRLPKIFLLFTALLLCLVFAFYLILPNLIQFEWVQKEIRSTIASAYKGRVEIKGMTLRLWPNPRVEIQGLALTQAKSFEFSAPEMQILPKIWPLFKGRFQIADLQIFQPEIRLPFPKALKAKKDSSTPDTRYLLKALKSKTLTLAAILPAKRIDIRDGKLNPLNRVEPDYELAAINLRLEQTLDSLQLEAECTGSMWKRLFFKVWSTGENETYSGSIRIENCQLPALFEKLYRNAKVPLKFQKAQTLLNLDFTLRSNKNLEIGWYADCPEVIIYGRGKPAVLKKVSLRGNSRVTPEAMAISVDTASIKTPFFRGAANFEVAPRLISMHLEGSNLNAAEIRQTALSLWKNQHTVDHIFDVIRAGRVPSIRFSSIADSWGRLGKMDNFFLQGQIQNGRIHISGPDLNLSDVGGEVRIEKGVLYGRNLAARLDNTLGKEGVLNIDLNDFPSAFNLDIKVDTDLNDFPSLLAHLAKNDQFTAEMERISNVEGHASGRFRLGDHLKRLVATAEVDNYSFKCGYDRVPYEIFAEGNNLHYTSESIEVVKGNAKIGQSTFSGISGSVRWKEEPVLTIADARGDLAAQEFFNWLKTPSLLSDAQGWIHLKSATVNGPLFSPSMWQYTILMENADLRLFGKDLPENLKLSGGNFLFQPEMLSFSKVEAKFSDATLLLGGRLSEKTGGALNINGPAGNNALDRICRQLQLPKSFQLQGPLNFKDMDMAWNEKQQVFTGWIFTDAGPSVYLDLIVNPQEARLRNLEVRNGTEMAQAAGVLPKGGGLEFGFNGLISQQTVARLFNGNHLIKGRLNGHFRFSWRPERISEFLVSGTLEGNDITIPTSESQLRISELRLDGNGKALAVEKADVAWKENRLFAKGSATISENTIRLDGQIDVKVLDGNRLEKLLNASGDDENKHSLLKKWNLPVWGCLGIKTERFVLGKHFWSPVSAEIQFSPNNMEITIGNATICGVDTAGVLNMTPGVLKLELLPAASAQNLDASLTCLFHRSGFMTGTYNLNGKLVSEGPSADTVKNLNGELQFFAKNGRIHRYSFLGKIFALLNVTEIFRGRFPDLVEKGFGYDNIRARAKLSNGILQLQETVIDGSSMSIVLKGTANMETETLDLKALVAPFKTVDSIIERIPVIKNLFEGKLISIPFQITGKVAEPVVKPVPPSAVDPGLFGLLGKTLQQPLKIIQPLLNP